MNRRQSQRKRDNHQELENPACLPVDARKVALGVLRDAHAADDVLPELDLEDIDAERTPASTLPCLTPLVRRRVKFRAIDQLRAKIARANAHFRLGARHLAELADLELRYDPRLLAERQERDEAVQAAVSRLSSRSRDILRLRFDHDLSLDDISRILGVTRWKVRQHLKQAFKRLEQELTQHKPRR